MLENCIFYFSTQDELEFGNLSLLAKNIGFLIVIIEIKTVIKKFQSSNLIVFQSLRSSLRSIILLLTTIPDCQTDTRIFMQILSERITRSFRIPKYAKCKSTRSNLKLNTCGFRWTSWQKRVGGIKKSFDSNRKRWSKTWSSSNWRPKRSRPERSTSLPPRNPSWKSRMWLAAAASRWRRKQFQVLRKFFRNSFLKTNNVGKVKNRIICGKKHTYCQTLANFLDHEIICLYFHRNKSHKICFLKYFEIK